MSSIRPSLASSAAKQCGTRGKDAVNLVWVQSKPWPCLFRALSAHLQSIHAVLPDGDWSLRSCSLGPIAWARNCHDPEQWPVPSLRSRDDKYSPEQHLTGQTREASGESLWASASPTTPKNYSSKPTLYFD